MKQFAMNGRLWQISFVDPNCKVLVDRTGTRTLATTDPRTNRVYLSNRLYGQQLVKVLIHEISHCALISFDLLNDIHKMTKQQYWIEAEEWVCNLVADYGLKIFTIAYSVLGYDALRYIPYEIEKMVA